MSPCGAGILEASRDEGRGGGVLRVGRGSKPRERGHDENDGQRHFTVGHLRPTHGEAWRKFGYTE